MTPEEAIDLLYKIGLPIAPEDVDAFRQSALEDLALYRRQIAKKDPSESEVLSEHELVFNIPKRYADNSELFLVFSSFLTSFLDPIDISVEIARMFPEVISEQKIQRVAIVSEGDVDSQSILDEIKLSDDENLDQNLHEMTTTTERLGKELFGNEFSLGDFLETGETHESD